MAAPTEKELQAIEQFRGRLSDLGLSEERNSDMFLVRWLRARELNLDQAEEMLRKNLEWRTEHNVDSLLSWTPPAWTADFPFEICGYDKDNCPIVLIPYGKWDIRGAVEAGNKPDYVRHVDRIFELVDEAMKQKSTASKPVTQFIGIYDVKDLGFRQLTSVATVDTILEAVRRFEANHPETLKTVYCINSSRIFVLLYGLIKPFLTPRTVAKVQIFASNANKWKKAILQNLPADQLPKHFGGLNNCSIKHYANEANGDSSNPAELNTSPDGDLIAVTVDAGEKLNIEYEVKYPNTVMSWRFKTDHYDIGFSLYNGDEQIVSHEKVNSHETMQTGTYTCMKSGIYTMCFDNTYSMIRGKTLHYMVGLASPEEHDSDDEITSL